MATMWGNLVNEQLESELSCDFSKSDIAYSLSFLNFAILITIPSERVRTIWEGIKCLYHDIKVANRIVDAFTIVSTAKCVIASKTLVIAPVD